MKHKLFYTFDLCSWLISTTAEYDDNSVLPEQRLPFARVRLPPKSNGTQGPFVESQEVEVFSSPGDSEVGGWWRATVKVGNLGFILLCCVLTKNDYTQLYKFTRKS